MSDKKDFERWLKKKLTELNTDESVFGSYIMGILEGDETRAEKREGLEGILSAILEDNLDSVIEEILVAWQKCEPTIEQEPKVVEDVDTKLARLMETQQIATTVQRKYTDEELKIREQILSQYSQVEYDDGYEEENDDGAGACGSQDNKKDPLLMKNTNAADVAALAKERREQAKIDSKAKKDKDKEDREKQKQLREEKKEKRKTVKGERRR